MLTQSVAEIVPRERFLLSYYFLVVIFMIAL